MNAKQQAMIALVALPLPLACGAASPVTNAAIHNCARAEATLLDVGLARTQYRSNVAPEPNFARANDQMIVTARSPQGERVAQMVCTYDKRGQIVSIRPVSPLDNLPLIDATSAP